MGGIAPGDEAEPLRAEAVQQGLGRERGCRCPTSRGVRHRRAQGAIGIEAKRRAVRAIRLARQQDGTRGREAQRGSRLS